MNKDELIVQVILENIKLREENEKLRANSIPITKIYADDLSAVMREFIK